MNWKNAAIEDLRNYEARKIAVLNMTEQLKTLEAKADGLNSVSVNSSAVKGGGNVYETALVNNLDQRARIEANLKLVKAFITRVERGLSVLSENEKTVLQYFYIARPSGYINQLCDMLNVEQATVYRIKDDAIYHFTLAMYGYSDI